MSEKLRISSRVLSLIDYEKEDLSEYMPDFQPDSEKLERDIERVRKTHGMTVDAETVDCGDMVEISCESEVSKFNKDKVVVPVGKGLYSKELEEKLIGLPTGEAELEVEQRPVKICIKKIHRTVLPELNDENIKTWNMEGVNSVEDLKRQLINRQIDAFRDEDDDADMLISILFSRIMDKSLFELDEEEVECMEKAADKKTVELQKAKEEEESDAKEDACDYAAFFKDMMISSLKGASIGYMLLEKENKLLTTDDYMTEINKRIIWQKISREQAMEEYTQMDFAVERYSEYFFVLIEDFVGKLMKRVYNS